jgi:hypothetical protein
MDKEYIVDIKYRLLGSDLSSLSREELYIVIEQVIEKNIKASLPVEAYTNIVDYCKEIWDRYYNHALIEMVLSLSSKGTFKIGCSVLKKDNSVVCTLSDVKINQDLFNKYFRPTTVEIIKEKEITIEDRIKMLKKELKHCKFPLERKRIQQELDEAYKKRKKN